MKILAILLFTFCAKAKGSDFTLSWERIQSLEWKPPSFAKELLYNARDIFGPNAWERGSYKDFAKVALALYLSQQLDQRSEGWVDDWHREAKPDTSGLSTIGELGDVYSFVVIGGFYAAGKIGKNTRELNVARDSIMASIIAAGIITPSLKLAVGRSRPYDSDTPYEFRAFGGDKSFPSGHTTQAFALASTIAEHYESKWVKVSAYGVASLVGLSRIERDAHFPSDVVAGALIGTYVGRKISRLNGKRREKWDWQPYIGTEGAGITIKRYQKRQAR